MSTISLKVEAFAGTTIEDACRDLCALADRVGILCEVGFNGVKVWAYPGTDPAKLAKAWAVQMDRPEHIYRIASARPDGVGDLDHQVVCTGESKAKDCEASHPSSGEQEDVGEGK